MSKAMKVPAVGESITEVTVGKWFKNDGDRVQLDEVLCELESDKATFEFPAEAAGTLRIKVKEGDTVEIGGIVCEIEEASAGTSSEAPASPATPDASAASAPVAVGQVKEMIVPPVGESITEVTLARWLKREKRSP